MTHEPKIPMRPEDLPQQRIHEVVGLPERPAEFNFAAGYGCISKDSLPEAGISSATFFAKWNGHGRRCIAGSTLTTFTVAEANGPCGPNTGTTIAANGNPVELAP